MKEIIKQMTMKDIARFWAKVDVRGPDECWPWTGAKKNERGYGSFGLKNQVVSSHQVAIFLYKGWPHDSKLHACHHCDNPPCCNGDHLFYGTHKENHQDASRKGRCAAQTHLGLVKGTKGPNAKLNAEQVRIIRSSKLPQSELASIFGLTQPRISDVINLKSYLDVL